MSDYLQRLQVQEPLRVPIDVLNSVRHALVGEPSLELVDRAIRRLKLRQYEDHAVQIYCRLAGLAPLRLDPEQQFVFWRHFERVLRVWPNGKSFVPFPYIAEQLLRMQSIDASPFVVPTKSPEKLRNQERLWKDVCQSKL
jgi:hypothetical protein